MHAICACAPVKTRVKRAVMLSDTFTINFLFAVKILVIIIFKFKFPMILKELFSV